MSLIGFDDGGNLDDKSARSVFVGNIPYEVTEERLKEIFSAVGQVLSFKLVYDRENGKPRGYGFCEYPDPHLARTAINNLNGYEVAGRALRVDSASTEKSRLEMQNLMSSASSAGQAYGNSVEPDKAPESISKAVASLPPEQMFELMKQMKVCIEHDPQDARHMLLQNPQLAYALLQALVVMRIVDPEIALAMLHNPPAKVVNFSAAMRQANPVAAAAATAAATTSTMPNLAGPSGYGNDPPLNSFDPHRVAGSSVVGNAGHSRAEDQSRFGRDPRSRDPRADRGGGGSRMMDYRNDNPGRTSASAIIPSQLATTDPDHAQLIMQVLQLTDEQISMLPLDQQASILDLKRQLNSMPK